MKNKSGILLGVFFLATFQAISQTEPIGLPDPLETPEPPKEIIYDVTEEQAVFPGGLDSLNSFLSTHLVYPKDAIESQLEGKVYVKFIIDETGRVINPVVVRGVSGAKMLDAEALRITKTLHFEQPGKLRGQPVKSYYVLPVVFKLH